MEPQEISRPGTSATAIASLVCGLLGCVPFLTGLAALVLGVVGIKKTKEPMVTGRGMAVAGLILGCLSLVGWSLFAAALVSGFSFLQTAGPAQLAGERFTRDLSEGKIGAALAASVEGMDREKLVAFSNRIKPWGELQNFGINSYAYNNIKGKVELTIGGSAIFANETKIYTIRLRKAGETYKIEEFDFP